MRPLFLYNYYDKGKPWEGSSMRNNKGQRVVLFFVAVILIAIAVFLIIQAVWYDKLDHTLQLEQNGFFKDDVTMLTFGQSVSRVLCWVGGVITALLGLACIGLSFDIIEF